MKVVFRVDASDSIASGHVARCLTLAAALRRRGAECIFISREVSGHLFSAVVGAGFEQRVLPGQGELLAPHQAGVVVRQALIDDALDTINALDGERPRWLVIDHYAIDDEWERLLQPHVDEILVIDDLADRAHHCDVLLDQNFSSVGEERYVGLVREDTRLFCGPRYALLQPEFARYRATLARQRSSPLRALVSFGGSDRDNVTGLTLEALLAPHLADVAVDVAIGLNNPHRERLEQLIDGRPGAHAHIAPESLAPLMAKADFAIGAGGGTTWERFCLDLPSVVVALASNQVQACESLHAAGRIDYVGFWSDLTPAVMADAITRIVSRLSAGEAYSPEPLVDGMGADRVAEVMAPSATTSLVMRPATHRDIDSYFWWVNDPEVRRQSITTTPVSWPEHQRWFAARLASADTVMFVLESNGLPIGQVRFDFEQGVARLDYSLDRSVRGRGLGAILVRQGIEHLSRRKPTLVTAQVRHENQASVVALTRVGFNRVYRTGGDDFEFLSFLIAGRGSQTQ